MSPFSWDGQQEQEREKERKRENANDPNRCVGFCQHTLYKAGGSLSPNT